MIEKALSDFTEVGGMSSIEPCITSQAYRTDNLLVTVNKANSSRELYQIPCQPLLLHMVTLLAPCKQRAMIHQLL